MTKHTINYRFNKHGRASHCFDIVDETGYCVAVIADADAKVARREAEAWLRRFERGERRVEHTITIGQHNQPVDAVLKVSLPDDPDAQETLMMAAISAGTHAQLPWFDADTLLDGHHVDVAECLRVLMQAALTKDRSLTLTVE